MKQEKKTDLTTDEQVVTPETDEKEDNSKQLPPNVQEKKGRRWLPYVITAAVLTVFALSVAWASGVFTATEGKSLLSGLCDAFFIPGAVSLCVGLLILVSNGGAFDMFAYGGRLFIGMFKKDPLERKYGSYQQYREARKENKRSFWYFIIVGGAYIVVAVILLVIYSTL